MAYRTHLFGKVCRWHSERQEGTQSHIYRSAWGCTFQNWSHCPSPQKWGRHPWKVLFGTPPITHGMWDDNSSSTELINLEFSLLRGAMYSFHGMQFRKTGENRIIFSYLHSSSSSCSHNLALENHVTCPRTPC